MTATQRERLVVAELGVDEPAALDVVVVAVDDDAVAGELEREALVAVGAHQVAPGVVVGGDAADLRRDTPDGLLTAAPIPRRVQARARPRPGRAPAGSSRSTWRRDNGRLRRRRRGVADCTAISPPQPPNGASSSSRRLVLLHLCNGCARPHDPNDPRAARGRCSSCAPAYERDKSRRRRATRTAVRDRDSARWQQARERAKLRDGGCVQRHRGDCSGAIGVHHVVPLEQDGAAFALENLVCLCRRQHEEAGASSRVPR
jgi:hypothetical protein